MAIVPASSLGSMGALQSLGGLNGLSGLQTGAGAAGGFNPASFGQGLSSPPTVGNYGTVGLDGAVPLSGSPEIPAGTGALAPTGGAEGSFESALSFIDQAATQESQANTLETAFAQGKNVPLHQVMAAAEEASLSLETLAALRDRVLDAVNELTKMQI